MSKITTEPPVEPEDVPLDPTISELLREDADAATASVDSWTSFEGLVWARIDETSEDALGTDAAWAAIADTIRQDASAALADFEARHAEFEDGFALRWAEDAESGLTTVGDVIRDEVETAVAAKATTWTAFVEQVLLAIDRAERVGPGDAADRAVVALRSEVDAELDAMAPRFDGDFREGIERRIFRAARPAPSRWHRWWDRVTAYMRPAVGLSFAAATAAAVALVTVGPLATAPVPGDAGHVSISAVRFGEATVTVMPNDDGIAVVWVTDDAS